MPNLALVTAATSLGAVPSVPTLTYTAQNQFTIGNYDSSLTYTVTGGTRSGSVITVSTVGTTATVTARYGRGVAASAARSMLTAAYARVLTTSAGVVGGAGCGPRPTACCPGSTIMNTNGNTCGSGGTQGAFAECGSSCPGNCYGLFITCWNWRWNNYSDGTDGTGYTLIGNTWGKVT